MKVKKILIIFLLFFNLIFLFSCANNENISSDINPPTDDIPITDTPQDDIPTDDIKDPQESEEEVVPEGIFASCNALPSGDGSYLNPWDIKTAFDHVGKNEPLYIMPGVYNMDEVIRLKKNGNVDNKIKIIAYKGDVVLDYGCYYKDGAPITDTIYKSASRGMIISGNYYYIEGIHIKAAGAHGMYISGSFNEIVNCIFSYNGNTGLEISSSGNDKSLWPHDNLIKHCTSYGNYDWNRSDGNQGEDADGFACKITAGDNNIFDGCISYNNSDDGWDLFTKQKTGAIGSVTIKNCIAFQNGYSMNGEELKNGNGFKLGGRAIEVNHYLENCIAFNNKATGFDDNSNPGTITLKNCTGYNNKNRNFGMGRFTKETNIYDTTWYEGSDLMGPITNVPMSHNIISNCLSYNGMNKDLYVGDVSYSYLWENDLYVLFLENAKYNYTITKGTLLTISNPFKSITLNALYDLENIHTLLRDKEGNIKLGDFLSQNEVFMTRGENGQHVGAKLY